MPQVAEEGAQPQALGQPTPRVEGGTPLTSAWGSVCLLGSPERTDVVMDIKHLARVGAEQVAGQSPPR